MNYSADLSKKNQIILISYALFFCFYILSIAFNIFSYNRYYILATCLFFIFIYLLIYANVSPKIIQLCIVVCLNVLILLLISETIYILNIYWLIFYLILISFYYSMSILLTASVVVSIEMTLLILSTSHFSGPTTEFYILIALGTALIIIAVIQSIFVYQKLKQEEKIKQAELQLARSKQAYLQLFFESANDAIAVFNSENKIIEVNPAFEKLYGWSKEESIGNLLPIVPPKRVEEAKQRFSLLLQGHSFSVESEHLKKDGTIFDAQLSLSPLFNRDGEVMAISVITRDISYRKEHERLQMQSEKLKLAGEIAAGVAHEIRNPMTVISSFVQMMQMDENSSYTNYVSIVQDEIERIDLIISEFLVLSKPQVNHNEWINLIQLIQEIYSFYELQFKTKSIHFEFECTLEEAPLYGNKNQMKQVFINLIKNAIEAIQLNGYIKIVLSKNDSHYLITIHDNGCGISEEHLNRIFEPFYTTKTKGTGLGMMITNKIIQEHNGSIKVFSKEKFGTDIHIQLTISESSTY